MRFSTCRACMSALPRCTLRRMVIPEYWRVPGQMGRLRLRCPGAWLGETRAALDWVIDIQIEEKRYIFNIV